MEAEVKQSREERHIILVLEWVTVIGRVYYFDM